MVVLIGGLFVACGGNDTPAATPAPPANGGEQQQQTPPDDGPRQVLEFNFPHSGMTNSARQYGLTAMAEYLRYAVDGWEIVMNIFPANQVGTTVEQIAGVQSGVFEMTVQPTPHLGGFQPLMAVFDVPWLIPPDVDDLIALHESPAGQYLLGTLEEVGIIGLNYWHDGYGYWTANQPLETLEDFDGLRVRVMPSPMRIAMVERMGGSAINMDWLELYNAMMTGAVEAHENPLVTITDAMIHEVQAYLIQTYHNAMDHVVIANPDWFNSLEPEVQEAIRRGAALGAREGRLFHDNVLLEQAHEIAMEYMTLIVPSAHELERWRAQMNLVREDFVSAFGDRAADILEMFDTEIARIMG